MIAVTLEFAKYLLRQRERERDRQTERKRVRRKNAKNKALSLGECKTNRMLT